MKRFWNWITGRHTIAELRHNNLVLITDLERARFDYHKARDIAEENIRRYQELRAQMMQIRVSQSTTSRAGWEIMCFIPEEIMPRMRQKFGVIKLAERVARELVVLAFDGINRVRANGSCCALVFEPLNMNEPARAPRFVQALWDHEGKFKLSEKCWDTRTEEQRVKNAAGCV